MYSFQLLFIVVALKARQLLTLVMVSALAMQLDALAQIPPSGTSPPVSFITGMFTKFKSLLTTFYTELYAFLWFVWIVMLVIAVMEAKAKGEPFKNLLVKFGTSALVIIGIPFLADFISDGKAKLGS